MEDFTMSLFREIPGIGDVLDIFDTLSSVISIFKALSVIYVIALIIIPIVAYIYNGLTLMLIGRKSGLDKDWMPFVPFASTLYRLQIVGEQWWKMFFLGVWQWICWSIALGFLLGLIHDTVATIFIIIYTLCCVAYSIYYLYIYYKAFNINPLLVLACVTGVAPTVNIVVNFLIGYTNLINYKDSVPELAGNAGTAREDVYADTAGESGSITCLSGMYSGNTFNMVPDEEMTIGREASECNIVLDKNADKVSRKHVGILYNPANRNYYVTDYSSNGTLTKEGSRLVKNIPTTLPAGTVICLGNNENRFLLN